MTTIRNTRQLRALGEARTAISYPSALSTKGLLGRYVTNWELLDPLQYLRPSGRGTRLIWVEVICINQSDRLEQEAQVAKLGSIYRRYLRVVVYLRASVALRKAPHGTTLRLSDVDLSFMKSKQISFARCYNSKYFSRIWIIQELLLAPFVIIPAHGTEITTGILSSKEMSDQYLLPKGLVPWLQYINNAQGRSGKDVFDLLRYTWSSNS